ncbi:MAG TPA: hypothetical protein VFG03_06435 [Telluria sp.]|nr:hypothetical protein [Telluria sp.]
MVFLEIPRRLAISLRGTWSRREFFIELGARIAALRKAHAVTQVQFTGWHRFVIVLFTTRQAVNDTAKSRGGTLSSWKSCQA